MCWRKRRAHPDRTTSPTGALAAGYTAAQVLHIPSCWGRVCRSHRRSATNAREPKAAHAAGWHLLSRLAGSRSGRAHCDGWRFGAGRPFCPFDRHCGVSDLQRGDNDCMPRSPSVRSRGVCDVLLATLGFLALIAAMLELLLVSHASDLCDTSCNGRSDVPIWVAGGLVVAAGSVALLIATWLQHRKAMTISAITVLAAIAAQSLRWLSADHRRPPYDRFHRHTDATPHARFATKGRMLGHVTTLSEERHRVEHRAPRRAQWRQVRASALVVAGGLWIDLVVEALAGVDPHRFKFGVVDELVDASG